MQSLTASGRGQPDAGRPWFPTRRRVQTDLDEQDPTIYDPTLSADYWRRVCSKGFIVNAGSCACGGSNLMAV